MKKYNKKKTLKIKKSFVLGFCSGVIIAWFFSVFSFFIYFLAIAFKRIREKKEFRRGLLAGIVVRTTLIIILLLAMYKSEWMLRFTKGLRDGDIKGIVFGQEIGQNEAVYRYHAEKARRLLQTGDYVNFKDPFSGKPFLFSNEGVPYSIGPDFQDNRGLIIYDPTNGMVSKGDILLNPSYFEE